MLNEMSNTDVAEVAAFLSCDERHARHYLRIFNNDKERAICAVTENSDDPDWWGHRCDDGASGHSIASSSSSTYYSSESSVLCDDRNNNCTKGGGSIPTSGKNDEDIPVAQCVPDDTFSSQHNNNENAMDDALKAEDGGLAQVADMHTHDLSNSGNFKTLNSSVIFMRDDLSFYACYKGIVDSFVDAVCSRATVIELRQLIVYADEKLCTDIATGRVCIPKHREQGLESNIVNRLCYKHNDVEGRSPLSYAVAKNLQQVVYDLISLGANVSKTMPELSEHQKNSERLAETPKTALTIAATNSKRDNTEMVRILLSKGAKPMELESAGINERSLNITMRYWLDKARRIGTVEEDVLHHMAYMEPMNRMHELDYAVIGEEAAIATVQQALASRFGNPQGNKSPLVMLLLGSPGHGKTYFSINMARSLVGKNNFLFVSCQSIRDDADLFGSRIGGSRNGEYSSEGLLTSWLRERQRMNTIVFLDEFEKIKGLHTALGWDQDKKIYQSFLEPWQEGSLSDQSAGGCRLTSAAKNSAGGNKIDCSQTIWILTSNWGQKDIIDFCDQHKDRVYNKMEEGDVAWLQKKLVQKILRPLVMQQFGQVHSDLKALCRRIDEIIPFLPFTKKERKVVADTALRERFAPYREPCIIKGPRPTRRSYGNLHLRHTKSYARHTAESYDPMHGASAILAVASKAEGLFQRRMLQGKLELTKEQKSLVMYPEAPRSGEIKPTFYLHYDGDTDMTSLSQVAVDDESDPSSDESDNGDANLKREAHANKDSTEDTPDHSNHLSQKKGVQNLDGYSGAGDDVF